MVLGIVASIAAAAPTALHITSKIGKFYGKYGNTSLGQAAQFGIGYGAATNIGYNLSSNYITGQNRTKTFNSGKTLNLSMPYGNYGRSRSRKIRVWSRRYRRYIWVYPRRRY